MMEADNVQKDEIISSDKSEKKEAESSPQNEVEHKEEQKLEEHPDSERVPQKKSVFLMVLLSIITLNIYPAFWYRRRTVELNNLGTTKKISKKIPLTLISLNALFFILLITFGTTLSTDMGNFYQEISSLQVWALFAMAVIYLFKIFFLILIAFHSRAAINQALENKGHEERLSGLFTLVFNLYYLQYEINRIIEDKEDLPKKGPWMFFTLLVILLIILFLMFSFGIVVR